MLPIGAALLVVGGLVIWATSGIEAKMKKSSDLRRISELTRLNKIGVLSLDDAEDAAVLARRYGMKSEEVMFTKQAIALKKDRESV